MKSLEYDPVELVCHLLGPGDYLATPFGAGKFSNVYSVTEKAGDNQYVLRVAPQDRMLQIFYEYRMMRQEPAVHKLLLEQTAVPVPPILAHDFSRHVIDRDYLIMPKFSGTPLSEASLNVAAAALAYREWGKYVRQIHGITDPDNRFGYLGEHRCMEPQPTWREAFRIMYNKLLDDIVACDVYDKPTADNARALLDARIHVFDACVKSHLCHGDLWVTNLLVEPNGRVTGVLDFDRACWGDIEWDLAIAEYCGVTNRAFCEGYGRVVETGAVHAAVRRLFYLLYEHQKYIVISMSSRRSDPAHARRYAKESLGMMEQLR